MNETNKWFDNLKNQADKSFQNIQVGMCGCHSCIRERGDVAMHMVLCPVCGNKRCPKANDHLHDCTNSNEPGQKGSAYE